MTVTQTVDWRTPEMQLVLNSIQARQLRTPRLALAAALTLGVVLLALTGQPLLLIAAAVLTASHAWITRTHRQRLQQAAQASGLTTYHLTEDGTLHIQNHLGQYEIPAGLRGRTHRYPQAITIQYAGNSTLTIPDGPVRTALERSHP